MTWGKTNKQEMLWHTFWDDKNQILISLDILWMKYIELQSEDRNIASSKMKDKHKSAKVEVQITLCKKKSELK